MRNPGREIAADPSLSSSNLANALSLGVSYIVQRDISQRLRTGGAKRLFWRASLAAGTQLSLIHI